MKQQQLDQETKQVNAIISSLTEYQRIYLLHKLQLSNQMRAILKEIGMTQSELSEKWGIPLPDLKKLLLGTHQFDLDTISKIECRYDEFLKSKMKGGHLIKTLK